ncbi:MAG: manganese-dependent inorganic pyrophosphatase [Patescibacteria group bacterium]
MPIYIIGHKSPDLDSVAAAISYANLKNKLAKKNVYEPAIAGKINGETVFALKKFGFKTPKLLSNAKGKEIILVDHNEASQTVEGASEAKINEVIDHHKVDFSYSEPIALNIVPWGSSCSIIAEEYWKNKIKIEKKLASLMLSAVLIDTVITKSPTCTEKDKEIIKKLSKASGIKDWKKFGLELFKIRANVKKLSAREIIKSDFKDFNLKSGKFGIGQVETVDLKEFEDKEEKILSELKTLKESENYHTTILFITDIMNEGSKFLLSSSEPEKISQAFNAKFQNGEAYIKNILSRKKQVVPMLMKIFDK